MSGDDLERRVAELEALVEHHREYLVSTERGGSGRISRRGFLQGLGVVGLGAYATGTASADPQGQLGTANKPVRMIYTQRLAGGITDGTRVDSLAGPGLRISDGVLRAAVTGAATLGDGNGVFASAGDGTLSFRSLIAGDNTSIDQTEGELVISGSDTDTDNDGANLGTGAGLYTGQNGDTLTFRSLIGGSNVSLSTDNEAITIDASAAGEANTASNVGTGSGLFKAKSGTDLEFRSLAAGSNLSISAGTDTLTLDATDTGEVNDGANLGSGSGVYGGKSGSTLDFRSLVGGSNLSISAGSDALTLDAMDTHTDVSEDGSTVVSDVADLDFATNLSVTDDGDGTVTVDSVDTGEVNNGTNLGGGTNVYSGKSGTSLEFRSFKSGGSVSISSSSGEITITGNGEANTASNTGTGKGLFKTKSGTDLVFKSLIGGSNLSVSAGTDALTLDATDTDTHTDVSDGGSTVLRDVSDINFGTDLSVTDDADGSVTVDASTTDTRTNVSDNGSTVVTDSGDINFATNLTVTNDGDGTVTVDSTGEANTASNTGTGKGLFKTKSGTDLVFRSLTTAGALSATQNTDTVSIGGPWADGDGDSLLEPRSGTGYTGIDLSSVSGAQVVTPWVGTSSATAFEAFVNSSQVAHFGTTASDHDEVTGSGNVVFGQYNTIKNSPVGAVIGGGGRSSSGRKNIVTDDYGTVGGGNGNQAGSDDSTSNDHYATVGGGIVNTASGLESVVAGGSTNTANSRRATISGGYDNLASGENTSVIGGYQNEASGTSATVGGGYQNTASTTDATVAGGANNTAKADRATISGGKNNTAGGNNSMVPGGLDNSASGYASFAAGRKATAGTAGTFVWGDGSSHSVSSSANDEFIVQAGGGATIYSASDTSTNTGVELASGSGSWSSLSTVTAKSNFQPIDPESVLDRLVDLDIQRWGYTQEDAGVRHMGPVAEQFYDAFGLGPDETHISTVDADGVAFAAIQGLAERVDTLRKDLSQKDGRIDELESETAKKDERIEALEAKLESNDERIDRLEDCLSDVVESFEGVDCDE
ncbi:hypothetical protein BRC91_06685 [Halobacteriales archaeon QS_4_62_28]|nr:MAG: hypothetical protein BRC91_06685 [Halobacteriales archaeon QS_4_62_28]